MEEYEQLQLFLKSLHKIPMISFEPIIEYSCRRRNLRLEMFPKQIFKQSLIKLFHELPHKNVTMEYISDQCSLPTDILHIVLDFAIENIGDITNLEKNIETVYTELNSLMKVAINKIQDDLENCKLVNYQLSYIDISTCWLQFYPETTIYNNRKKWKKLKKKFWMEEWKRSIRCNCDHCFLPTKTKIKWLITNDMNCLIESFHMISVTRFFILECKIEKSGINMSFSIHREECLSPRSKKKKY